MCVFLHFALTVPASTQSTQLYLASNAALSPPPSTPLTPPPHHHPPPSPPAALEKQGEGDEDDDDDKDDGKMNRAEKKARKAIIKLGLKPVPGVERVSIKKAKTPTISITRPDVYKTPGMDTYVIFGTPDEGGAGAGAGADPYARMAAAAAGGGGGADYARAAAQVRQSVVQPSGDGLQESADESGLEAKDIELVVTQAGVTRGKAVAALRKTGGDIVNAIMELTSA